MPKYLNIQRKLHSFIRKYYTNELIKGIILFLSFGLLYFIFTLIIEYFLWLETGPRTFLFWFFVIVELLLFFRYILYPVFKLIGFAQGISLEQASVIIGKHFPEIDDKLLNLIQLHNTFDDSELVLASIAQKASKLQPIPFSNAIRFTANKRYLKYLIIPALIYLMIYLSGKLESFNESYVRIMHPQQVFVPPAPFSFKLRNPSLNIIEGQSLPVFFDVIGDIIPEQATIFFNDEHYFLQKNTPQSFSYIFENPDKDFSFYVAANGVESPVYNVHIIPTPKIQHIRMDLKYPKYVHKLDKSISNTGTVIVPSGTRISWFIQTEQADSLYFLTADSKDAFVLHSKVFSLARTIYDDLSYTISASNQYLSDYEKLNFSVSVVQDAYPVMDIKTDIDSIAMGPAQFIGKLSDDYGLSKLELIYYNKNNPTHTQTHTIPIPKATVATFYYIFPQHLELQPGADYEFYFKLYDNDAVKGPKFTKSKRFSYHKDTAIELEEKMLLNQKQQLQDLSKSLSKQLLNRTKITELSNQLKSKEQVEFQTTSKLQQQLNQQKQSLLDLQQKTQNLYRNLEKQPLSDNPLIKEQQQDLLNKLKETQQLLKEQKLLDELQKLADKLNKEELLDKLERMSTNSKQREKSLAQLLELTKRFYVEQKVQQLSESLSKLADKEDKLAQDPTNNSQKQKDINDQFNQIKKDIEQLNKDNQDLKEPMDFSFPKQETESITKDLDDATKQLDNQNQQAAKPKQKSAASKMQKMSKMMQAQLQMAQGDMIQEDIALLRQIIENLITFSYKQEDLMTQMSEESNDNPNFARHLKYQNTLQTYFEHIDDSLYVLSLRQPKLASSINTYLADAHYYLHSSITHYTDNQYNKANSDQHYVMKAANDLALLLSRLLDNMESMMMGKGQGQGKGKGKGSSGSSFSLPDIIKQQDELAKSLSKGKSGQKEKGSKGKKGEQEGNSQSGKSQGNQAPGSSGFDSAETYKIYQQQARLRYALEKQLQDLQGTSLHKQANSIRSKMEDLERMILEKGVTNQSIQRMLQLRYELLKLKNAKEMQQQKRQRQSSPSQHIFHLTNPKQIEFYNTYYKQIELLNREILPFNTRMQQKVKHYFNSEK